MQYHANINNLYIYTYITTKSFEVYNLLKSAFHIPPLSSCKACGNLPLPHTSSASKSIRLVGFGHSSRVLAAQRV